MINATNAIQFLIYLCFAMVPLALAKGSFVSFVDFKIAIVNILSLLSIAYLSLVFYRKKSLKINYYLIFFFLLIFLKFLSFNSAVNPGLFMQHMSLMLAAFFVCLFALNSEVNEKTVLIILFPAIIASILSGFYFVFFKKSLFSTYVIAGGTIGLKNSLAIYLAQVMPLLLAMLYYFREQKFIYFRIILLLILVSALFLVILYRTRSAWWMLILMSVYLIYSEKKALNRKLIYLYFTSILAILLVIVLPNSLIWNSSTPYLDSFKSLVSFSNSSGRNHLWRVALEIVKSSVLFGIGTSNYSVLWPSYIKTSGVDPKNFAFLRPDLPLFNDYLQVIVENGIFVAALFVFLIFLYPLKILLNQKNVFLLSAVLISFNAFFDSPFTRAENLLLFVMVLGISMRSLKCFELKSYIYPLSVLFLASLFALFLSYKLFSTVYYRRVYYNTQSTLMLEKAWQFWPYDMQLRSKELNHILDSGNFDLAKQIIEKKIKYWPYDPENNLLIANFSEKSLELRKALVFFQRATKIIDGGNCYKAGFRSYLDFVKRNQDKIITDTEMIVNECK